MLSTYANMIEQIHTLPEIQFSLLNLSSLSISVINEIPTKLMFISELNLDNNLLVSLNGIQQFMNLEILTFNFNFISQNTHLLQIRNKFLIKELSFLGNQIQRQINASWLVKQGFTGLLKLNQVGRISHIAMDKVVNIGNEAFKKAENHIFWKENSFFDKQNYRGKAQMSLNSSKSQQDSPSKETQNQTKLFHNNNIENNYFLPFMRANMTKRLTKNKEQFQSTGDTRKKKMSFRQFNETSRYGNSFEQSPNFNKNFRDSSFNNANKPYLQSTKRRKISEFMLYPVDQEIYRSKRVEKEIIQPRYPPQNFGQLQNSKNQLKRIKPFEETEERPYQNDQLQRYNPYRSDHYYLKSQGTRIKKKSENSDNNIIEREIPVYKQAIAIAFYYRNLLEKVFTGFDLIINQRKETQNQQNKTQHQNDRQDLNQNLSQNSSSEKFEDTRNSQLKLKKYAWMKLELFVNQKKIIDKYTQSLIKH